eukprot:gnl/Trimastix_PCT/4137.p2 GENE.gnl/Trimastix_PCT/4137~~gnl/Trimastix_PCT/4137.p2  ORF type:complete len:328 (+),score=51.79 gnl/Trimastix_PCT/4137:203-1186(+)
MSSYNYTSPMPTLPPSPQKEDPRDLHAIESCTAPSAPTTSTPTDLPTEEDPQQIAGPWTHFILAAALNFLGVIVSRLIAAPAQVLYIPCSLGLSVNFILISTAFLVFTGTQGYRVAMGATGVKYLVVIGALFGALTLLVALFLACSAYYASKKPGTQRGWASEFIFYMLLGLCLGPFGLYGMFHPSRRANLGAAVGAACSYLGGMFCLLWLSLAYHFAPNSVIHSCHLSLAWLGVLICLFVKLAKDDLNYANGPTFYFAGLLTGPLAWAMTLCSPHRGARAGALFGLLSFVVVVGVASSLWAVYLFGIPAVALLLLIVYPCVLAQRR